MGQFDFAIKKLTSGDEVIIKPHGNSMVGLVNSGDTVVVRPASQEHLPVGSIVLVKVRGNVYLHLIKAIRTISKGKIQYQIGNNRGRINGWVNKGAIYGKAISVNGMLL